MRKRGLIFFTVLLIVLSVGGCTSEEAVKQSVARKVSVSESREFDRIDTNFFFETEDPREVNTIRGIISSAVKKRGIVDMADPEYDMEVIFSNGDVWRYHLWIGNEGETSTLMNVEDTHTIYTVKAEDTNRLLEILEVE
ncbi:hypothetical protein [Mangrovibacillus cuniculi]|uniref:YhfM-like domain-containing protein n=1 Tax=Mangrovibacillus cuniculi TaxID=2593652 RepID=A0A7S8C8X0_9BACI|nr:hypothetical protein [Mangrovibacillus cuniculi]QPC45556.1 hypothetical protein G8O30_00470 [Mangrovibacillus cuniculi]